MRMSSLLFWALALLTGTPNLGAEEVEAWFANHDQLMSMEPKARRDYLREMRNILTTFEVNARADLPSEREASFRALGLLPEAEAAIDNGGLRRIKCDSLKNEYWSSIGTAEFCLSRQQGEETDDGVECPKGFLSVGKSGLDPATARANRRLCYSRYQDSWQPTETGSVECPGSQVARCLTVDGKIRCKCNNAKGAEPEGGSRSAAPASPLPPTYAMGPQASADGQPPVSSRSGDARPAPDGKSGKTSPKPAEKPAKKPGKLPQCQSLKPTCADDREQARKDFFSNKRACVYAGNISQYKGSKPTKYGCKAKSFVTLKHEYKCTSGVMCNPLVFCVPDVKSDKAYCAKRGMEATDECNHIAKRDPGCIETLIKDYVAKETWDQFLVDLKQVCTTDQASARFHCKECRIMYDRIFNLNTQYFGDLCVKNAAGKQTGGRRRDEGGTATTH